MAMALEWGGLRLGLMALGYQQVIWTHLHCVSHGVFKIAIAEELEEYPCPICQQACKVAIVAQGFTKYALPPPERLSKPLSPRTRFEVMRPDRPQKIPGRIPDRHASKYGREVASGPTSSGFAAKSASHENVG